jgi:hypothetical protein
MKHKTKNRLVGENILKNSFPYFDWTKCSIGSVILGGRFTTGPVLTLGHKKFNKKYKSRENTAFAYIDWTASIDWTWSERCIGSTPVVVLLYFLLNKKNNNQQRSAPYTSLALSRSRSNQCSRSNLYRQMLYSHEICISCQTLCDPESELDQPLDPPIMGGFVKRPPNIGDPMEHLVQSKYGKLFFKIFSPTKRFFVLCFIGHWVS